MRVKWQNLKCMETAKEFFNSPRSTFPRPSNASLICPSPLQASFRKGFRAISRNCNEPQKASLNNANCPRLWKNKLRRDWTVYLLSAKLGYYHCRLLNLQVQANGGLSAIEIDDDIKPIFPPTQIASLAGDGHLGKLSDRGGIIFLAFIIKHEI